eukprot:4338783-Amphidinium_carterae.1
MVDVERFARSTVPRLLCIESLVLEHTTLAEQKTVSSARHNLKFPGRAVPDLTVRAQKTDKHANVAAGCFV